MSLPDFSPQGSLFSTALLGTSLFSQEDRFRLFALLVYPRLMKVRAQLAATYSADTGRTAIEPVLLLGVSLLQFLDGVPDRQAVELLRYHAGWNFALNRQLGDPLFHPTTLCRFRERLETHQLSELAFKAILDGLVEAGLVPRASRQRLDSTQVFGMVSRMSRVECVRESLRLCLQELEPLLPPEGRPPGWARCWERYVDSQPDYRASRESLTQRLREAGEDTAQLLAWLDAQAPGTDGPQLQLLRRVFDEQFLLQAGEVRPRLKGELDSARVQNPHDADATYGVKGEGHAKKEHVGYKVQVAETVVETPLEPAEPTRNFVTGIATQPAHHSDEAGARQMEAEQAAMGLEPPPVLYVDGAYLSAGKLVEAAARAQEWIGPVQPAPRAREGAFSTEDFEITVEQREARCPAGKPSDLCGRLAGELAPQVQYRFEWKAGTCADCALRDRCLGAGRTSKVITVGEHHSALQQRRREQKTEAFRQRMRHRHAIEGTQSELVRAHGLRRARYRGLGRVRLQNYLAAAACNLKRWIRRWVWEHRSPAGGRAGQPVGA